MINPFSLIKDIYNASEAGQQLANADVWAKRASATQQLSIVIVAGLGLANQFLGQDINLSPEDLNYVVTGIAVIGGIVANKLHVASNPNAGRVK